MQGIGLKHVQKHEALESKWAAGGQQHTSTIPQFFLSTSTVSCWTVTPRDEQALHSGYSAPAHPTFAPSRDSAP